MNATDVEFKLEIVKIYSQEYMDKHRHYWSIYFRFVYAIIGTLGIFVLSRNAIEAYLTANKPLTTGVFCVIILVICMTATIILSKERMMLLILGRRYTNLLSELGMERFPKLENEKIFKFEKFIGERFFISSTMVISLLILSGLAIVLIILVSFLVA